MAAGNNQFNPKIMGKIINLLRNEPLVIAQSTGNSLEERKPVAFFWRLQPSRLLKFLRFLVASLLATATSSINAAISSKIAKILMPYIVELCFKIMNLF